MAAPKGNKFAKGNAGGRPLKYTLSRLKQLIDDYFATCAAAGRPLTITGLALALDTTRETLCDYENKAEFSDTIKKAKEIVANFAEEQCLTARNPAGAIFIAKNHGFKDKTEQDINLKASHVVKITDMEEE